MLSNSEIPMSKAKSGPNDHTTCPEISRFKTYLQNKRLAPSTIKWNCKNLEFIERWCTKEKLALEELTYNDLLDFIRYDQQRGCNNTWINKELCSLRHYYSHLIKQQKRKDNPARDLYLKGIPKKVLQDILKPDQLEKVYRDYTSKPDWSFRSKKDKLSHQRNKVILGLLIYQGIQTGELKKLYLNHINLTQGTIYIPAGRRRSSSRILKLQAVQMLPLQEYLNHTRTALSKKTNDTRLFNITKDTCSWLISVLKRVYPVGSLLSNRAGIIKSASQIRSSVIINWLKQYNLRQVQYMAGHKHINSTERYKQEDLEDLQKQLEQYHPLK